MGKKSKRNRTKPQHKDGGPGENIYKKLIGEIPANEKLLQEALMAHPSDRLYKLYDEWLEVAQMHPEMQKMANLKKCVSKADIEKDNNAGARSIMIKQLSKVFILFRLPHSEDYRNAVFRKLQSSGGMETTFVAGRSTKDTFAYTYGFTSVGGKEVILQDVHKSMGDKHIGNLFNFLFAQHKGGHPLQQGQSVQFGNVAYTVVSPEPQEAILLKAARTLDATRLYGLSGYDVFLLTPVGLNAHFDANEDILLMGPGVDTTKGFNALGKKHKLEACAWCHTVRDSKQQEKLMQCGSCKRTYYCCPEHQRLDWPEHKKSCRLPKEEFEDVMRNRIKELGLEERIDQKSLSDFYKRLDLASKEQAFHLPV